MGEQFFFAVLKGLKVGAGSRKKCALLYYLVWHSMTRSLAFTVFKAFYASSSFFHVLYFLSSSYVSYTLYLFSLFLLVFLKTGFFPFSCLLFFPCTVFFLMFLFILRLCTVHISYHIPISPMHVIFSLLFISSVHCIFSQIPFILWSAFAHIFYFRLCTVFFFYLLSSPMQILYIFSHLSIFHQFSIFSHVPISHMLYSVHCIFISLYFLMHRIFFHLPISPVTCMHI